MSSSYVDFEELLPIVLQSLFNEGIEEKTFNKNRALYAIRQAYIEFIKRTNIIRRTMVIHGQANVSEYPLFKEDEYIVGKIYSVETDACCYTPSNFCQCNCCPCTYNYQDGFLNICPPLECDEDISICVALFPSSGECKMEERIYELYGHEIAMGAVSRLVSKKVSAPFEVEYDAGIHRAASAASNSWSKSKKKGSKIKWAKR